jgi:predicted SAM-dependent methyltransferase
MVTHQGVSVSNSIGYSLLKFTDEFTARNNLRFAVGFYEDEKIYNYVDLVAGIYKSDWIIRNEDKFTELKLHPCSDEELDAFYPIRESQKHEFNVKKR